MTGELVQITKSACAPLIGMAMFRGQYDELWAADCIAFNDEVLTKLVGDPAIDTVILASIFTQVMSDEDDEQVYRRGEPLPVSIEARSAVLAESIATLQKADKRVIGIEPTPWTGIDHGACGRRQFPRPPHPVICWRLLVPTGGHSVLPQRNLYCARTLPNTARAMSDPTTCYARMGNAPPS